MYFICKAKLNCPFKEMKIKKPTTDCMLTHFQITASSLKMPVKKEKLIENEFNGTLSTLFCQGITFSHR